MSTSSILSLCIAASFIMQGCSIVKKRQEGPAERASTDSIIQYRLLKQFSLNRSITPPITTVDSDNALWAAAHCDCAPGFKSNYFTSLSSQRGVLPQTLVPSIREQIRNNSSLQTLQGLPFGDALTDFFVDDAKISSEISTGLSAKISNVLSGSSPLENGFKFDHFISEVESSSGSKAFQFDKQIARWNAVFGSNGLWDAATPLAGSDHGLQTLEVLRTMSEWNYLFGLSTSSSGGVYGGLTLDPNNPGSISGPFDPRHDPSGARYFSGLYKIQYPNAADLEMAVNIKENWSWQGESPMLREQARKWETSGLAFKRLRLKNRTNISKFFGTSEASLFPEEASSLPLTFLSGLSFLLEGPLVVKESRLIRAQAKLSSSGSDRPADISDLSAMIRGLTTWVLELKDLNGSGLDPALVAKLSSAPSKLLPAIQLATQKILQNHVQAAPEGSYGISLSLDGEGARLRDVAVIGEALSALILAEQSLINSPLLKIKIIGLFHWYVGDVISSQWNSAEGLSTSDIIWAKHALDQFRPYADNSPWYEAVNEQLTTNLANWDGQQ